MSCYFARVSGILADELVLSESTLSSILADKHGALNASQSEFRPIIERRLCVVCALYPEKGRYLAPRGLLYGEDAWNG